MLQYSFKDDSFKGEINIVTEVDILCENTIIELLKTSFPDHDILAEESGGTVTDFKDNFHDTYKPEIVAANSLIHDRMISIINS